MILRNTSRQALPVDGVPIPPGGSVTLKGSPDRFVQTWMGSGLLVEERRPRRAQEAPAADDQTTE